LFLGRTEPEVPDLTRVPVHGQRCTWSATTGQAGPVSADVASSARGALAP